ncbi:hypothetical protein REPUB_Repub17cG0010000 [Reevesia pubescens]
MDEPTSGLDARAAAIMMRTVVCTIHQPSIEIFEAFVELLLMKRGQVIYGGKIGTNSQILIDYFQMNSLSSLLKVCHHLPDERNNLKEYEAERFKLQTPQGKSIVDIGCEPILHMRHFQAKKEMLEKLVYQVLGPHGNGKSVSIS